MFQLTRYPASIYAVCQASARFSVAHRRLPPPGPVPGGAHQLVQHGAHLGLRRHGGGGGGGARAAGRGWGAGRALPGGGLRERGRGRRGAASRRAEREPEGLRQSPGCAAHDAADVEDGSPASDPRALTLRPVPGTEATRAEQALASDTATRQKPSAPPPSSDAADRKSVV